MGSLVGGRATRGVASQGGGFDMEVRNSLCGWFRSAYLFFELLQPISVWAEGRRLSEGSLQNYVLVLVLDFRKVSNVLYI